ncbi:hypothetical protein HWC68_gp97 [Gordonia phage Gibbin]|uniref:Uncharacterized protein n=1 Tax=Gordonia phage Gibbin TaxID=2599843 RepID=A0A5J6TID9_9CAUD|nr:hypothetical protein HWC68_gp97 [Gordonia phage Gibbin]QFG10631.1 hypothetical protein PBI_GIBBIN_97 [Gordonia phage Gibbin]
MGTTRARNIGVADTVENRSLNLIGKPDGPMKYIDEFGFEVGTFTNPRTDLYRAKARTEFGTLMHHVPPSKRGYYRPEQCADYDPDEFEYIVDQKGYALCTRKTKSGKACASRALHMSWVCTAHGGALHPLDKAISEERALMPTKDGVKHGNQYLPDELVGRMTRYQKLVHGIIAVEDLDDEELARGQCRDENGRFSGKPPKAIPKDIHDALVRRLFERAREAFQAELLPAIQTLGELARSDAVEPADRIKAASLVIDRVMGKNAEVIVHKQDAPWEVALKTITGGSRAESRRARGLDPETGEPMVDAEIIDEEDEYVELPVDADGDASASGVGEDWDQDEDVPVVRGTPVVEDEEDDYTTVGAAIGIDEEIPGEAEAKKAEEAKNLRDRLKEARRQRYSARNRGLDSVEDLPYTMKSKKNPDGEGYLITLTLDLDKDPGRKRQSGDFG